MDSANLHDGAQLLNSPDQALHHRNHSPENAVLGHRLGSPIKGDPEPSLEHTRSLHTMYTSPGHWEDLEEVSSPDSGYLTPPRAPTRFASVRSPPALNLGQASLLATRCLTPSSICTLQLSPATSITSEPPSAGAGATVDVVLTGDHHHYLPTRNGALNTLVLP